MHIHSILEEELKTGLDLIFTIFLQMIFKIKIPVIPRTSSAFQGSSVWF